MSHARIKEILELARWAPSGDNTQVWRFELLADDHVAVHCRDTRADTVYDLDGHPSQISYGALFETMAIAASGHGLRTEIMRRPAGEEHCPVFDVRFVADPAVAPSPLIGAITRRTVQRRPMKTRPLDGADKAALEACVGAGFRVQWIEGRRDKLKTARLMYDNARLRLSMPEAFEVHKRIIHWNARHSPDRVPDQALGVDAMTLKMMKWAMHSWGRMSKMNAVMGTWAPRLQMDLLPGVACAAHFVLKTDQEPKDIDAWVEVGRAVQRFWLTLTARGLYMQPEMTPLIFSRYVRHKRRFTDTVKLHGFAEQLRQRTAQLIHTDTAMPVYMGRLGFGPAPVSRSHRLALEELMHR
jgi:nitroreductase